MAALASTTVGVIGVRAGQIETEKMTRFNILGAGTR
jgi:hypothetical protein